MEIIGVSHPIPTEFAERVYNQDKTVFVSKSFLGKVLPGDKFIIYESHGAKAYTGWADIRSIGKQKTNSIFKKYGNDLIITKDELNVYARGKAEMNVIEFENFEKFKKAVPPKGYFVTVAGKYIYEDEFKMIENKKD